METRETSKTDSPEPLGPRRRLLIIEDDPADAELYIATLEEAGLAFEWTRIDRAADLEACLSAPEPPDLILSDFNLPAFDGLTALQLVRQRHADLPFILVSDTRGEESAADAIKAGATDYVLKSNLRRLAVVVERACAEYDEMRRRRQAETALHDGRERYRAVVQATLDAVWEMDLRTKEVWWNEGITSAFGYAAEEVDGNQAWWFERVHPEDRERVESAERALIATGQTADVEYRFRRGDGTYVDVLDRYSLLHDEHRVPVRTIGFLIDITEGKHGKQALRRLSANLERQLAEHHAQLECVNQELQAFGYALSHDLRAPLRAIRGFADILMRDCIARLDAESRGYLERVHGAAERLERMIEALRELSRIASTEIVRREVDLTALAQTSIAALCQGEPGRVVEVRIADRLAALGDQRLLRAMLDHLLGNAWKFTARQPQARIEVGATVAEGQPAYFVRDNGAGFDIAYASKLFHPFRRLHTSEEFPGIGVGLAIAARIARRHGGRIWADATPGQGATFLFTLPES